MKLRAWFGITQDNIVENIRFPVLTGILKQGLLLCFDFCFFISVFLRFRLLWRDRPVWIETDALSKLRLHHERWVRAGKSREGFRLWTKKTGGTYVESKRKKRNLTSCIYTSIIQKRIINFRFFRGDRQKHKQNPFGNAGPFFEGNGKTETQLLSLLFRAVKIWSERTDGLKQRDLFSDWI